MENTPLNNDAAKPGIIQRYERLSITNGNVYLEIDDLERIIEHYLNSEQLDAALEVANLATEQHYYNSVAHKLKVNVLIAYQHFENAAEAITTAVSLAPEDLELKLLEIECISLQGNESEAIARLNSLELLYENEELLHVLYCKSNIYERMSDFHSMFDCLSKMLYVAPTYIPALERIWFSVELSGRYEESVTLHHDLIDEQPYNHLAWYNLGHAYTCLEDYDNALMAYEYSFIVNEDFEYGYRDYADLLILTRDFERALDTLKEIKLKFGQDSEVFLNMGQCYLQLNKFKRAKQCLIKAKEFDPLNDKTYFQLGLCEMAGNKLESSVYYLSIATELDNMKEEYFEALSSVFLLQGQFDLSVNALKQAIEIAPENWKYIVDLSKLYIELFHYNKAYDLLLDSLENLDHPAISYCLAITEILIGEEAKGIYDLNCLLTTSFEDHHVIKDLNIPAQFENIIQEAIFMHSPQP